MFVRCVRGAAGPLLVGVLRDATDDVAAPLWVRVGVGVRQTARPWPCRDAPLRAHAAISSSAIAAEMRQSSVLRRM
jgi:hypothetical protein